jgi:hypothetical protein
MILPKTLPFAIQLALLFNKASADLVVDWHWYPTASQGCLQTAQNSVQCPSGDVPSFNGCVCRNVNNFLQVAAQCLGMSDNGDLTTVYNVLVSNCGVSQTPVQISLSQWLSWASSSPPITPTITINPTTVTEPTVVVTQPAPVVTQPTIVTQQATTFTTSRGANAGGPTGGSASSATETPVPGSSGSGKQKLGTGATIGLGIGIPGCCAVIGLLGLLLWRSSRRQPRRFEGEPVNSGSYGTSPGTAVIEAYQKTRPESSIPSTASPDPGSRMSGFSTGQGGVPYVGQGGYPVQQYQGLQPQFSAAGQQYVTPTSPMHDIRYPPPGTYSELSSEARAEMPGTQFLAPQGGSVPYRGPG